MSEQHPRDDDMEELERITSDALHARAAQVEPSPDAYARLADRVAGASRRPAPWWQAPRLLWLGAAGATAAIVAIALVMTVGGDDGDQVATPAVETPTPAPAEATPMPAATTTPDLAPTPSADAVATDVIFPFDTMSVVYPSGEAAAAAFYRALAGSDEDPVLRATGATPGTDEVEFLVMPTGPEAPTDPTPQQAVATIVTIELGPGRWGVTQVISGFVSLRVDGVEPDGTLRFSGESSDDAAGPGLVLLDAATGAAVGGGGVEVDQSTGAFEAAVSGEELAGAGDRLLALAAVEPFGSASPALTVIDVDLGTVGPARPTPVGAGPNANQGRPDGVIWPVEAVQPFGEWPTTPEDAAQQFVQQLGGWTLPVGDVTFLDPILMIADVVLQFTDESGEPFGTSTRVRVVGGFDDAGVQNWGVQWALSDFIEIDRTFFDGNEFLVSGAGQGFEGVIEARLVDPTGNVAAEGFVTAGGVEMGPIEGSITLTENLPGPGFALLFDVGGLGTTPSSLTIVPIELPELDSSVQTGDPDSCSAAGLEPPAPDPNLPDVVEARRQAIAGAAIACDWEVLAEQFDPSDFSYSFGENVDAIAFWQQVEADGGDVMRFLVETLKLNWVLDDQAGASPESFYIWPDAFPMIWEDVTEEMRDALRPLYDDRDFEGFANIGGFAGYRIAITDSGQWLYFVAGD